MIKIFKKNNTKQGYATLELLFYIALFTMLSLVVIDAMIIMAGSFRETSIQAEFVQSRSQYLPESVKCAQGWCRWVPCLAELPSADRGLVVGE